MNYVIARLESIVDLLLTNPDHVFKLDNKYFNLAVSGVTVIIWIVEEKEEEYSGFIRLEQGLGISTRNFPKPGYIPIIDVVSLTFDGLSLEKILK